MKLTGKPSESVVHAWEDVKAMFNGGTRKRLLSTSASIMALRSPISSTSSEKDATMENSKIFRMETRVFSKKMSRISAYLKTHFFLSSIEKFFFRKIQKYFYK